MMPPPGLVVLYGIHTRRIDYIGDSCFRTRWRCWPRDLCQKLSAVCEHSQGYGKAQPDNHQGCSPNPAIILRRHLKVHLV